MKRKGTIAVRLEGGLGDHLLGMRLLYFIKERFPRHKIIAYSDASGGVPQMEAAKMSPLLSEVIPVYHKKAFPTVTTWGSLENIEDRYLRLMRSADLFFDAWGQSFFLDASRILDTSFNSILARPPEISVPKEARLKAAGIFNRYPGCKFVGLDVSKHGLATLKKNKGAVQYFIRVLLKDPKVIILNFYLSKHKFPHWPRALGMQREAQGLKESVKTGELWNIDERVLPVVDLPITSVAAMLERCGYFIGVDNGLKHLAWALGVPHTFFEDRMPTNYFIWRWMPNFNRMLLFSALPGEVAGHLSYARDCLKRCRGSGRVS